MRGLSEDTAPVSGSAVEPVGLFVVQVWRFMFFAFRGGTAYEQRGQWSRSSSQRSATTRRPFASILLVSSYLDTAANSTRSTVFVERDSLEGENLTR